jgi:hypothetical protein
MDLLYGMMLPSGNDAAIVIGEGLGLILHLLESKLFREEEEIFDLEEYFGAGSSSKVQCVLS